MGGEGTRKDRDAPTLRRCRRNHLWCQPEAIPQRKGQRKGRSPKLSRHRHRFEAYIDKVFGSSDLVSALPEGRQFPQHAWRKVFEAVFLGAAMQIPSLLQIEAEIQYYHRIVVVVLVSSDFPIPLGVRFQKNGETEVACARALLQDLVGQLGRRFLDVLVGDALYLQASFVKEVERLGLVWAFTLKENQPELLREAERLTQESPTGVHPEPGREIRYWHLPELDWRGGRRRVRVVKTVRIEHQRRVTVSEKDAQRTKGKTAMSQQSTNFYATNFELGSISPLFIHQLSRSRWRIDTEVFQTITTDCHLKHPAV